MKISIAGYTGFVGSNLYKYLFNLNKYTILLYKYKTSNKNILQNTDVIVNLIGKAHDLKGISNTDDYYFVNYDITKEVFNDFLSSSAKKFIFLSSIKVVTDFADSVIDENFENSPKTHYGLSKLMAENYILSHENYKNKLVYILRPSIIYGPNNKGNLPFLFNFISKFRFWPLGSFNNERSFCSVDNLNFVINEIIERNDIPSGVYNVCDSEILTLNKLINIFSKIINKKIYIIKIPKFIIIFLAKFCDLFNLPISTYKLNKLTESYVLSNKKLLQSLGKDLPIKTEAGLIATFK